MNFNNISNILSKTKKSPVELPVTVKPEPHWEDEKGRFMEWVSKSGGKGVLAFFKKNLDSLDHETFFMAINTRFKVNLIKKGKYNNIVNTNKINSHRWINKFFEAVNDKLPLNGLYIGCVELYTNRKKRILAKYPYPFNGVYYFLDVILKRVFPKLPVFKKLYFIITHGRNRALSKAETFGRLYSCGFDVIDEKVINNNLFFVAQKTGKPKLDPGPTYGALVRLQRYGKGGQLFNVYKFRTMYPFSEYLQDYVYKKNYLQEGGKFKNDFRITTEGKFLRKFWLDELPMLINVCKNEIKIFGVRPLSEQYFSLYSEELKNKRMNHKPGLVPPYYVDLPKTLEEIMASEMKYLEAYERHPLRTDIFYFFRAVCNILCLGYRSN